MSGMTGVTPAWMLQKETTMEDMIEETKTLTMEEFKKAEQALKDGEQRIETLFVSQDAAEPTDAEVVH